MSNPVVAVTVTANTKPYTSAMDKAATSTTKVDKASAGLALGMAKTAGAAAAAGVSIAAFSGIVRSSIQAATELEDSTSKMGVVFGSASKDIVAFANDSTRSFGLSKRAAFDATSTFAILGKAAGLTGQDLTKFSTDLTQRAVDLSSFFGGSVQDAIVAVGAALRGESEPIRAYGVLLDDATLRAAALEMGLISSVKEGLTPQTRAIAAQAEVLRQSSDAAGDYTNTIDGMANSAREAAKAWEDAKAEFGTLALPIATKATQAGAEALGGISALVPSFKYYIALLTSNEDAANNAEAEMRRFIGTTEDVGPTANSAAPGLLSMRDALLASGDAAVLSGEQIQASMASLFGYIDAMQAAAGASRDLAGAESRIRDGMTTTTAAVSKSRNGASDEERKAVDKVIDGIRRRDAAEQESEIKAARRRAQRKAEARADAGARRDVQGGVAGAIATDKAARAGQDLTDGFKQGGSTGEATGTLSKSQQKALDKEIEGIRARHKKAIDAQVKGFEQVNRSAAATAGSVTVLNTSLDANTEAGRRNLEVLDGEVDRIQTVGQAAYDAAILEGKGAQEAGQLAGEAMADARADLVETYGALGFVTSQVDAYLAKLGLIPRDIKTAVSVETKQLDSAIAKANRLNAINKLLANPKLSTPRELPDATPAKPKPQPPTTRPYPKTPRFTFAAGGEIRGPGTPTSDSVPIWASRGEFMVNAQQYSANRELVRAINAGTGPVSAGGGISIGAVNVTEATASGVRMSVIDALAEAAYRNGAVR